MNKTEVKSLLTSVEFDNGKNILLKYIYAVLALLKSGETVDEAIIKVSESADVTEWTVRDAITNRIWQKGSGKLYIKQFVEEYETNKIAETLAKSLELNEHDVSLFRQLLNDDFISLGTNRLFKLSMGALKKDKKFGYPLEEINQRNWVVIHEHTNNAKAGNVFKNDLKVGDYFYVTLGGDQLQSIVRVKEDKWDYVPEEMVNGHTGWIYREVEVIKEPNNSNIKALKGITKFDFPSGNSTLYEIKPGRLEELNDKLFEPYYGLRFNGPNEPPIVTETPDAPRPNAIINDLPLNQILYGPPGTGKTYRLQKIIGEWGLVQEPRADTDVDLVPFVDQYHWWELVALALNDLENATVPQISQHPLITAKMSISSIKSLRARLWSTLQHHTVEDCPNVHLKKRFGEPLFYKEAEGSVWRLDDIDEFGENFEVLIEEFKDFAESEEAQVQKNYLFTTCHQSLSYEDFIEGIKPTISTNELLEDKEQQSSISYQYRKGYFYQACQKAAKLAGFDNLTNCLDASKAERERRYRAARDNGHIFVLFLDEINRCNVSAVFGELITLLEEDKRLGGENEIADVLLPYSQTKFGVPGNLHIIGTMNTADRSVEALDAALRRRFSFTEMMPVYDVLEDRIVEENGEEVHLDQLLKLINERISYLLDEDHQIGHSYFLKVDSADDLRDVFKDKIIPLLKEYFYNDYGKIRMVLGDGFVTVEDKAPSFAAGSEDVIERERYLVKPISDNFDIVGALKGTTGEA